MANSWGGFATVIEILLNQNGNSTLINFRAFEGEWNGLG